MRLTKENIHKYIDDVGHLYLYNNKEITHIDYIPDNVTHVYFHFSNVEEITCELPDGLESLYCQYSKLTSLPLLPKSLEYFDGRYSKLPKEFHVDILFHNIKCNNLRKLQMINTL